MRKTSIVPEIINREQIQLFDVNNIPVEICEKSNFKFNPSLFKHPSIFVDNYEKKKYKEIEIRRIEVMSLEKLGYRLVSMRAKGQLRNYPNQQNSYLIEKMGRPLANAKILSQAPKSHFIEHDVINNRLRISGRNGYPYNRKENATTWVKVER